MTAKTYRARALDLLSFAENAATLEGRWPLADLERLIEEPMAGSAADTAAGAVDGSRAEGAEDIEGRDVRWSAQGERRAVTGGAPQTWLHLQAEATVRLVCQRCLQPMEQPLHADRSFLFVRDEDEALRLDEDSEDDVLAIPPQGRLDLQALVEDELILSLPIVPRHDSCPDPLPMPVDELEDGPAEHPFQALAALKRSPG